MIPSIQSFARSARQAHLERSGFSAVQLVASGHLRIEAEILQARRRSTKLEFKTVQNPWTELEEALSGHVEYTADELCNITLHQEGGKTWVVDPVQSTATRKLGVHLYEPIPGMSTLGELSFLNRLTQDYLLRDLGEHPHGDGQIRRITLKPKQTYRVNLLSTVTFPIRSATIDFDTKTYFPYSISILPSEGSPAASIVGPQTSIVITYRDVQLLEDLVVEPFEPRADAHVFEESLVADLDLGKVLPFSMPLEPLSTHGFSSQGQSILVAMDAEKERAYLTARFTAAEPSSDEGAERTRLSITCGNYMSRNMARRRLTLSEEGSQIADESASLLLLDRSSQWEARFPGLDMSHAPVDAFFEKAGVFWFLSATNMEADALQALAEELRDADDETD